MAGSIVEYTSVKDIADVSVIKVCVIRMFTKPPYPGSRVAPALQLVCVDELGYRIESSIPARLIWKSAQHVREFATIIISKFKLAANTSTYKLTGHPQKIVVTDATVIVSCEATLTLPSHGFAFQQFSRILAKDIPSDCLFDVIGELIECTNVVRIEKADRSFSNRLEITLEDHGHVKLPITLWDDFALDIQAHVAAFSDCTSIVILQFAKLTLFEGRVSVSNALFGSRLILDQQHPAIEEFKSGFSDGHSASRTVTHISAHSSRQSGHKYFTSSERVTLDLLDAQTEDGFCTFVAKVVDFESREKWFYNSCIKCKKSVVMDGSSPHCDTCNQHVLYPVQRFSLQIKVEDETGSASLIMFDKDVQKFVRFSVTALREKQAKVGDVDAFPQDFDVLLNKKFIFRVKVKDDKTHTVWAMSDDTTLIDQCNSSTPSLQDSLSDVCSSGAITMSTPAKRRKYVTIDSGDENEDCQMSTTKQDKIEVKIEPTADAS